MADVRELVKRLAAFGVELPVCEHAEEACQIVDAQGRALCVVDHNGDMDDADAAMITGLLVDIINAAGAATKAEAAR